MPQVILYDSENPPPPAAPSNEQKSLPSIPGMPDIVIHNSRASSQPPPVAAQPQWNWLQWQWPYYTYPTYVYPQPVMQQPQQQPQVIIIKNELPQPPPEKKKEEKKKEEPKPEPPPPPPPPPLVLPKFIEPEEDEYEPQNVSKITYASLLLSFLGFVLGIACIAETYKAGNKRRQDEEAAIYFDDLPDDNSYNTIVLRLGSVSSLFYFMAVLCSWLAGSRHVKKVKDVVDESCCMKTILITGWISFSIAFTTSLIVMMTALDEDNEVRPAGVWVGFFMYLVSWMFMYGFSEMARKM